MRSARRKPLLGHSIGLSGKQPSPTTINARIGSYYRFLMRMELVTSNPCERLERPHPRQATAHRLSAEQVRRLLAAIPETPVGLRDRAIILTLVLTGRRRAEVLAMKAGDIQEANERIVSSYRGKSGKTGQRELPRPAFDAMRAWLTAIGREMPAWRRRNRCGPRQGAHGALRRGCSTPACGDTSWQRGYPNRESTCCAMPPPSCGAMRANPIEEVSRFLDHRSLAVTSVYLRRIEIAEDSGWPDVAQAIGI
jgi:integrase